MEKTSESNLNPRVYKWIPEVEVGAVILISAAIVYLLATVISRVAIQGHLLWQNMWNQLNSPNTWIYFVIMAVLYLFIGWGLKKINSQLFALQINFTLEHDIDLDQIKHRPIERQHEQLLDSLLYRNEQMPEVHGLMRFLFHTLFLVTMPLMALTVPAPELPPTDKTFILLATSTTILVISFFLLTLRHELDEEARTFVHDMNQGAQTPLRESNTP